MDQKLITFTLDTKKYTISSHSLLKFKDSLLYKAINGIEQCHLIYVDNNNVYIDRDPKSFSYIVDILRGYDVDVEEIKDMRLKNKVWTDLQFYRINLELNHKTDDTNDFKTIDESYEIGTTEGLSNFYKFIESQKTNALNEDIDNITSELDTFAQSLSESTKECNNDFEALLLKLAGGNFSESINSISTNGLLQNMIKKNIEEKQDSESSVESVDFDNDDYDNYIEDENIWIGQNFKKSGTSSDNNDYGNNNEDENILISQRLKKSNISSDSFKMSGVTSVTDKAKVRYVKIE